MLHLPNTGLIKYLWGVLLQFISQEQQIHTGRDHDFIKVALKKEKKEKEKKVSPNTANDKQWVLWFLTLSLPCF